MKDSKIEYLNHPDTSNFTPEEMKRYQEWKQDRLDQLEFDHDLEEEEGEDDEY